MKALKTKCVYNLQVVHIPYFMIGIAVQPGSARTNKYHIYLYIVKICSLITNQRDNTIIHDVKYFVKYEVKVKGKLYLMILHQIL